MSRFLRLSYPFIFLFIILYALDQGTNHIPAMGRLLSPFQGFWYNAEKTPLTIPKHLSFKKLKSPVVVYFDKHLIPHITAQNDHDLYFTQGYVTAFHRLWQMDFLTRYTAGRLSEIIGEKALNLDRLQRRKGLPEIAKKMAEKINEDPRTRLALASYIEGINTFIKSLTYKKLPIEYKLMRFKPELWTLKKATLVGVQLIDFLSSKDAAVEHTNTFHLLGKKEFNSLFPDYLPNTKPMIPTGTKWNFDPLPIITPEFKIPNLKKATPPHQYNQGYGSNNWVVSGSKSNTGKPLLANDLHLKLSLPSSWYLVHLHTPTLNVVGASLVGIPTVVLGFNENIAWGPTSAIATVRDWYQMQFLDNKKTEYYYDNEVFKTYATKEVIAIKGKKPFIDTIVHTHLGPIVYDETFPCGGGKQGLAMKWMGQQPEKELLALYLVNRAKNYNDFKEAFSHYATPGQNFAFASVDGDIALQLAGRYPARFKGQGRFVQPGNASLYRWQHMIPYEQNPYLLNPVKGFLQSANQCITDLTYPYYLAAHSYHHYRHRYLENKLQPMPSVQTKDMMALQNDTHSLKAEENLPFLLHMVDQNALSPEDKKEYDMLNTWNFSNDLSETAPTLFHCWLSQLMRTLWIDFNTKEGISPPGISQTLYFIRYRPLVLRAYLGDFKNLKELVHGCFLNAVSYLKNLSQTEGKDSITWKSFHKVPIMHLAQIAPFSILNAPIGGSKDTLNATGKDIGPAVRLIVELHDNAKTKGWMIYPGGQPGNPGNPYYLHFLKDWCEGKYISLDLNKKPAHVYTTLQLRPQL